MPHFYVADAAFPLRTYILKLFPGLQLSLNQRVFNYRLSRARRVIENAFGILVARWRILKTSINMFPENAEKVVLAAVALHNFIKINDSAVKYCPSNYVDWEDNDHVLHTGEWRHETAPLRSTRLGSNNSARPAMHMRNQMAEYFCSEGAVPFQYDMLN